MRQPSYARLLLLLVAATSLFGLMRHAQKMADDRAAEGEARFRTRAALFLEELYQQHRWQPHSASGHWLRTRGRRLVTDQGRRWHGIGADYQAGQPVPVHANFVRLSAASYLEDTLQTDPARLSALGHLIERLTSDGKHYVLLGVPASDPWLWRAQMATVVAAFADRPEVMFDVTLASPEGSSMSLMEESAEVSSFDSLFLNVQSRIEWIRAVERQSRAPHHVIAIDADAVASDHLSHHGSELDYARFLRGQLPVDNVVTIGRRPAYAMRDANAWFVEPLRVRAPSVHPATL